MKKLTNKQRMFCREYIVDFKATQASIRAGYSEGTARQMGSENLSKPVIAKYLQRLVDARAEECKVSAEKVVSELARHAFDDSQKIRLSDKLKALELLGKHLQIFKETARDEGGGFQLIIMNRDEPSLENGEEQK